MTPRHHLDPATVVSHAFGALSPELAVIASLHLDGCAECRRALARAEGIGGALIEQQYPVHTSPVRRDRLRAQMLEQLDMPIAVAPTTPPVTPPADPDRLPAALHPYFGSSYRALKWRWMGPGRHYIRVTGPSGGTLLMLRIGPGKRMPVHGHQGSELTQILRGAYHDALGHFAAGDAADLDADTEHQPVTAPGEPCICVAALDAPIRLQGWLARKLQSVIGI